MRTATTRQPLKPGDNGFSLVTESWKFDDAPGTLTADAAIGQLRARIASEKLESWLTSSSGRLLAVVTNTERAMVMLLDGEGDPGGHAVDPGADGLSDGFVLANGQNDEYPNEDTVPQIGRAHV